MTLAGLTGVMLSYISRTNANLADRGDVLLLLLSDQTSTATANSSSTIKFILFKQFLAYFACVSPSLSAVSSTLSWFKV